MSPPPTASNTTPNRMVDFLATVPASGKEKLPSSSNKPLKKPSDPPRDKARPGEGLGISRTPSNILWPLSKPLNKLGVSDRKSTRLNSSHVSISYAVFCLKKKKHQLS